MLNNQETEDQFLAKQPMVLLRTVSREELSLFRGDGETEVLSMLWSELGRFLATYSAKPISVQISQRVRPRSSALIDFTLEFVLTSVGGGG